MASTRLYRDGRIQSEGFDLAKISDLRKDPDNLLWLDVDQSATDELKQVADELGLHPLAVEDAIEEHQRAKLDRYDTHLFLTSYAISVPADPGAGLVRHELDMFVTANVLVTVRSAGGFDMARVERQWDAHPGLVACGVGGLLWGVLDVVVDSHFDTVQQLDERIDALEDAVFADRPDTSAVQRAAYEAHKDLVVLRRLALPMREVVGELMRRAEIVGGELPPEQPAPDHGGLLGLVRQRAQPAPDPERRRARGDMLAPYYQDVYDHTLRVADWTDSLRDLVSTILDTNLTAQGNRMNLVMKKVTSWAAIIAVPTFVTGFYGMNVAYPLINTGAGFWVAMVAMTAASVGLYVQFKARDWL
ncbi:MAG: magnesium transporter CorA family protein [Cellulomonadaceae bacterium]